MHHPHKSKESLFPVALRQLLDIVYHCSEQHGASRPVMTPGPYFRWAFVVLCPMRACETQKLLWSVSLEPSPLPVIRSAALAPEHEEECLPLSSQMPAISGAILQGRSWRPWRRTRNRGVREVCNTFAYRPVLRFRDEKTSDAEGKGKVRLWGVGGSSLWGDAELSRASFLKPVLSSSESWND